MTRLGILGVLAGWLAIAGQPAALWAQEPATDAAPEAPARDSAEAAPQESAADQNTRLRARQHYLDGEAHYAARRFREAVHSFQLAANLLPSADLWYNIARAYEELGDPVALDRAADFYGRYLRDSVDAPNAEEVRARVAAIESRAAELRRERQAEGEMARVRIRTDVEGAAVSVDDTAQGDAPLEDALRLSAGTHRVTVQADGHVPFVGDLTVDAGTRTTAYVAMPESTEYRSIRGRRIWTWIVGGLGLVAAGVGVALNVSAMIGTNDVRAQFPDSLTRDEAELELETLRDQARVGDYLIGGGIGLGVIAIILYFVEGRSVGTEQISGPEPADHEPTASGPRLTPAGLAF